MIFFFVGSQGRWKKKKNSYWKGEEKKVGELKRLEEEG